MPYRGYTPPPPTSSYSPPPQPFYSYSDPHSGYYSSYYSPSPAVSPSPAAPPPRPFSEQPSQSSYGGPGAAGPSAPVDYTPYDYHKRSVGKPGMGTGLAMGAMAGALGGLTLDEGIKYEEEKIAERMENDMVSNSRVSTARDDLYADGRKEFQVSRQWSSEY